GRVLAPGLVGRRGRDHLAPVALEVAVDHLDRGRLAVLLVGGIPLPAGGLDRVGNRDPGRVRDGGRGGGARVGGGERRADHHGGLGRRWMAVVPGAGG